MSHIVVAPAVLTPIPGHIVFSTESPTLDSVLQCLRFENFEQKFAQGGEVSRPELGVNVMSPTTARITQQVTLGCEQTSQRFYRWLIQTTTVSWLSIGVYFFQINNQFNFTLIYSFSRDLTFLHVNHGKLYREGLKFNLIKIKF